MRIPACHLKRTITGYLKTALSIRNHCVTMLTPLQDRLHLQLYPRRHPRPECYACPARKETQDGQAGYLEAARWLCICRVCVPRSLQRRREPRGCEAAQGTVRHGVACSGGPHSGQHALFWGNEECTNKAAACPPRREPNHPRRGHRLLAAGCRRRHVRFCFCFYSVETQRTMG